MVITQAQLRRAIDNSGKVTKLNKNKLDEFVASFNMFSYYFGLTTPKRIVHYLAQVFWESGYLRYTEEIASGAAYDTGSKAIALGNTPEKDGDGQRYKGRGYIQLTGKANYSAFNKFDLCTEDVVNHPEKVAQYPLNQLASMWFWEKNGLNKLADADDGGTVGEDVVKRITKKVNGGYSHLADRLFLYRRFKKEFGI